MAGTLPLAGPADLHFESRTYQANRIADPGFLYDANGNLIEEPVHDDVGGHRYDITAYSNPK